jgi:hypothetical protein
LAFFVSAAGAVHADPIPRGPLRLTTEPCATETGAELRCGRAQALPRAARPISYFEAHERLVMRDMISFNHSYTLDYLRERDTLRLYGPTPGNAGSVADGIALFSSAVITAAHLPGRGRVLFDHAVHVGPALFEGGGMGAGIGARM